MNEIPRLKVIRPSNKSTTRFEGFLYEGNLKEVNAFYDKYKDNPWLFFKDFPKEQKNNSISNIGMSIDMKWISCKVNNKDFKDWLHDLLYKVE